MNIKKEFGGKVRYYRTKKGLTQWKLADKANLHYTYVGSIERGEKNISLENIYKIADALNMKIADLLDFEQSKLEISDPDDVLKLKICKLLKNKRDGEISNIIKIVKEILKLQKIR